MTDSAKEEVELENIFLDDRHQYLIKCLSDIFNVAASVLEPFLLYPENFRLLDFLFSNQGTTIHIYYQNTIEMETKEVNLKISLPKEMKECLALVCSDGGTVGLNGKGCILFKSNSNTDITVKNIALEVNFLPMNAQLGKFLSSFVNILSNIYLPILRDVTDGWGLVSDIDRKEYFDSVEDFIQTVENVHACIDERVILKKCSNIDFDWLSTPDRCLEVAQNIDKLSLIEECAAMWMRQIMNEITEIELVRVEKENDGPHTELRYWKQRMARFDSLLEQLKQKNVQSVIYVLKMAKSKTLDTWIDLDKRVTLAFHSARDNVKFLQTISKYCQPLYHHDIDKMIQTLPKLMHALRMIYTYSTYYNTFANMTILFVKITNQIIATCKGYITYRGRVSIWEQDPTEAIDKMEKCINLNLAYQENYRLTKQRMEENMDERLFEFSEMRIFGNFDLFSNRLKNLITILTTKKDYAQLRELVIEGIEPVIFRLDKADAHILNCKQGYLDQRDTKFDQMFIEYKNLMNAVHIMLQQLINKQFDQAKKVMSCIRVMEKAKKINLPNLNLEDRYFIVLTLMRYEEDNVTARYTSQKESPPIERNMPPYAGRIAWARNLYRRLEQPMTWLKHEAVDLLKTKEGQKVVARYNRICEALIAYEMIIYRHWKRNIKCRVEGYKASVLIRLKHEEKFHYFVNLDPDIKSLYREIVCLENLGCHIPIIAQEMWLRSDFIKQRSMLLEETVARYRRLICGLQDEHEKLLIPSIFKLEMVLMPGLYLHDWLCLSVEDYLKKVNQELEKFEERLTKGENIRKFRIDAIISRMAKTKLVELPPIGEVWTNYDFLKASVETSKRGAKTLSDLSSSVYSATQDLLDTYLADYDKFKEENESIVMMETQDEEYLQQQIYLQPDSLSAKTLRQIHLIKTKKLLTKIATSAEELLKSISLKCIEAVVTAVRQSLEYLWIHLSCKDAANVLKDIPINTAIECDLKPYPIIKTEIRVVGNMLGLRPTLDEMQSVFKRVSGNAIMASKYVGKWTDAGRKNNNDRSLSMKLEAPQKVGSGGLETSSRDQGSNKCITKSVSKRSSSKRSSTSDRYSLSKFATKTSVFSASPIMNDELKEKECNCSSETRHDREVYRLHSYILSWITHLRNIIFLPNGKIKEVKVLLDIFDKYKPLWISDSEQEIAQFLAKEPSLFEFQTKFQELDSIQTSLESEPVVYNVGPLALDTEPLKSGIGSNIAHLKKSYMNACISKYTGQIDQIIVTMDEIDRGLSKNLVTLDDIAAVMEIMKNFREDEINMDLQIMVAEDSMQTMSRSNLPLSPGLSDKVESARYHFNQLQTKRVEVFNHILDIQGGYKDELLNDLTKFAHDLKEFSADYDERGPMIPGLPARDACDRQILFKNRCVNLMRKMESLQKSEKLFGLPPKEYSVLLKISRELDLLQRLYGLYNEVNKTVQSYYDIIWKNVNMEKISAELADFQNKCRRLPAALRSWPAYTDLQQTIDGFNEKVPLLEMMTNPAMKARHWQRLADLTKYQYDVESDSFTLKTMLDAPLLEAKEDVEDICISAVREKDIEAKLQTVQSDWASQDLKLANFKNRGELLLKGDRVMEINGLLEDSLMVLNSLMTNRYNAAFKKNIQDWVIKLTTTTEVLENWMRVQNLWVYLEAVFVGGDIAKQLPQEAKRFQNIDKSYVKIMERAKDTTNVVQCCASEQSLVELFPRLLEQLELCQKSLTGYLEKKRLLFPRFFFVSDPVLLEILGQASDPHSIQAHLLSIFDNIKYVKFNEKVYDLIEQCFSSENECLKLDKSVRCEGHVESWLNNLMKEAQSSLHHVIRRASFMIQESDFDIIEFLNNFQAQVGLLSIQLIWTNDATEALKEAKNDRAAMIKTNKSFLALLNVLIGETTKNLTKYQRTKFETLITIHVHQRDIFDDMCRMNIKSPGDFEWTKQTRFYFYDEVDKCVISITDVDFEYQNEFLGCTERLVITPLTDRCYITLAQALNMCLGGAPAGPAGTGKTETTKDMGRCLGKYVVVFNCSDQMDFRGLGRIFKGLAQSGTWGCFDEFNRIELPVLSVAAQQVAIILQCRRENKREFIFSDGDTVEMNPEFGLFLTMNPGYAGRQELPENLKINFRSVAMMVPDRQIIIRVKLAACGFIENVSLARKFFVLYKLCEEQLTKQVHYDFGLRNILSVLRTLGTVRRANPDDSEDRTVMRVLRDMNLSKLVDQDEPLFLSLISDLFPGIVLDKAGYPILEGAINRLIDTAKLIKHPPWILKVIQLYETQRVRHGMMTLGPSGTGKTCCIHLLMKALTETEEPHKEMRMNPKAITASEMFGKLDVATNDWTDGIFSTLWRRTLKIRKNDHVWLVLDGPVDAIWIENLNSVLDDNKTLTLANGDRIPMAPNCKIIFEVHNIDNASPATVSRNGMVFISSSALDWNPIVKGWLLTRPSHEQEILKYFETSFPQALRFVEQECVFKMPILEAFIARQACDILTGLLPTSGDAMVGTHLQHLYIFALMWSVGALLELEDRVKLQKFLVESQDFRLDLPQISGETTIFEFTVNKKGAWVHWNSLVDEYVYPTDSTPDYNSILVPNVDNVRTDFLIDIIAKQQKAVLLIGEQGTAKTVMINKYMAKYNPENHIFKSFNFSSATTPGLIQRTIESFVEKRVGSTFGPRAGKRMTVFIDDINMPLINEWGDQIANEIVRQLIELNGFYSLDKPGEFLTIVDMQYMAAMIHPGGGRNDIPQRLKRQFNIFNCTLPSNNSIDKIFSVIALGHYCNQRGFNSTIRDTVTKLIPLTRNLWQKTKSKMLPTPSKFHYVFNLRDLSRIWQGMINTISETISQSGVLMQLWKHEVQRVIADRFLSAEDLIWFDKLIVRLLEQITTSDLNLVEADSYFVDFMRDAPEATGEEPDDFDFSPPKIYEKVKSLDHLKQRLFYYQSQYNEAIRGANLDLVFFNDAMIHLVRISRIIRFPRGNALLVGVGGSGKQSLTRLASFIAGYSTFQITLTRSYNVTNLLEDLKVLYRKAGVEGKGVSFIFTDNEIKDETFLEYLNNILSSGVVSGLFARDEMDEMCGSLIPVLKKEFPRRPPTMENLNEYFITRVRQNLHVVLCFSPVGEKFRSRALKFPGLISGCTIDWFQLWPKDALVEVAQYYLNNYPIEIASEDVRSNLINTVATVQDNLRAFCNDYFQRLRRVAHFTPKSYLSFLGSYKNIYKSKKDVIAEQARCMDSGLQKLVEATESIAQLSIELIEKEKELAVANIEAEKVLKNVMQQTAAAEEVKNKVQQVKDRCETIVKAIQEDRVFAEAKLEAAKPALKEAEDALNTIKAQDISTVRKLAKPPHLIMRIMDCVLLLFKRRMDEMRPDPERPSPKPSWSEALKFMSQAAFLNNLLGFPRDMINEETADLMQPYLRMEDYNLETAKKVCGNVAGLLGWTVAMEKFFWVNKEVIPLKDNLSKQETRYRKAMTDLEGAEAILAEKEAVLAIVRGEYEIAMKKKQELEDNANACRRRMCTAKTLIDGLSGEKVRWTDQSRLFKEQIIRLVGDCVLATAFLTYSGPFNQEFRLRMFKQWNKLLKEARIPTSENFDLISALVDQATISEWNLEGLPNDDLSIQNGIISTKANRYPLLIDPQGQGKNWIKQREAKQGLTITTLNHKYFRQFLEDTLSLGKPLLIEDIGEDLDPALDNVLDKNFIKIGSSLKVKVGDKEVDIMKGFCLYLTTKLPNPAYSPEVSARTSIVNFTVTLKGLEDQLLGRVIQMEKEELENQRIQLVSDMTKNKRRMQELEASLLDRLANTKGSLVDDQDLLDVLSTTKSTSQEVNHQLTQSYETEKEITNAREEYRPVATRGSVLYFLITDLNIMNNMYQTGLKQFLLIFVNSMTRSEKSPILQRRILNIINYLTYDMWRFTIRAMYKEDRMTFTLLLAMKIDMQSGNIRAEEFDIFIKGGSSMDLNSVDPKPEKWLTDMTWLNLVALSNLNQFSGILSQVQREGKKWRQWYESKTPEDDTIPGGYDSQLDPFRRLLLIRSWVPDRTLVQARKYVVNSLGVNYGEELILDMDRLLVESEPKTPLLGLLSMGSDPTPMIEALGKKQKIEVKAVSMGQGQDVHARRLIISCISQGGWVLLQNCHLCLNYMEELFLQLTESDDVAVVNPNFRLWVTTEPHPKFPINFLQISIKFTNEPPEGLKASLTRTYTSFTQDFLDTCVTFHWKVILYTLAYLHTTVQERRKFGPLGWNIPYEFNQSDFNASLIFLQNHLDSLEFKKNQKSSGIDWKCVRYMLAEIQYGGRVTDDFDKRLLNTLTKVWFQEKMFQPEFTFQKGYPIPLYSTLTEYLQYISNLPFKDSPELFGLHSNAEITYSTKFVEHMLGSILNIQPKDSSGSGGETRESVVYRLANDMLSKLPSNYVPYQVKEKLQKLGAFQPMNIFLRQEVDRMDRVIKTVRQTLQDLRLAIDGTIIMNETLRDALDAMFDAKIPSVWLRVSWDSTSLGFWFSELVDRNTQFHSWLNDGRPVSFWMTGFFNAQGFLTAMRQEVTRDHEGWALDTVILTSKVTRQYKEEMKEAPKEGVYVYGLFLEGAGWDRKANKLCESRPKVLFETMCIIHIGAVQEAQKKETKGSYVCPIYKKPRRTDLTYVASVELPTKESPDNWIMRGVALLCDIK